MGSSSRASIDAMHTMWRVRPRGRLEERRASGFSPRVPSSSQGYLKRLPPLGKAFQTAFWPRFSGDGMRPLDSDGTSEGCEMGGKYQCLLKMAVRTWRLERAQESRLGALNNYESCEQPVK